MHQEANVLFEQLTLRIPNFTKAQAKLQRIGNETGEEIVWAEHVQADDDLNSVWANMSLTRTTSDPEADTPSSDSDRGTSVGGTPWVGYTPAPVTSTPLPRLPELALVYLSDGSHVGAAEFMDRAYPH